MQTDRAPGAAAPGLTRLAGSAVSADAVSATLARYRRDAHADVEDRRRAYAQVVNRYYDLVTDFFEYGWGQSFHFAPRARGETREQSILRHEHWMALRLRLDPSLHVLDVGCGVGGPLRAIARFAGCRITGINNNAYQVARAETLNERAGLAARCRVIRGDFMAMPLPDAAMDAAYAIEATVHAPSLVDVYREIRRVLKPGALFGTYEWCLTPDFVPTDPSHQAIKREIEIGNGLIDLSTSAAVTQAITASGFELLHSEDRAKAGDIPWWEPLAPAARRFSLRRSSGIGRHVTRIAVRVLESLRVAPRGATEVAQLLEACGRTLVTAGQQGLFTPDFFILARNPRS
ncbi:MAG: methyltransferase domain-containing protein [Acidisphaera sp.]|nr:methyltransferase domain-containing protein [Acidisphaera sp.]